MGELLYYLLSVGVALVLLTALIEVILFLTRKIRENSPEGKAKKAVAGKYGHLLVRGERIKVVVAKSGIDRPGYDHKVVWEGVGHQGNIGGDFWMSETGRFMGVIDFRSLDEPEPPSNLE